MQISPQPNPRTSVLKDLRDIMNNLYISMSRLEQGHYS